ncbi:stealth family protein [Leuconostoc mesenteroides]|uniref:stealth family protein n=1 Tax=Leuconostoc mesenteroides TaxID=1245 RepID=UPI0021A9339A|nr:stealth family protein [Leuconostoc mesenteroides]MCT3047471.1 sugar phosphotransferase [Leuconostoc mesenteroides]
MNERSNFPIDFVVTWVDGSDSNWLKSRKIFESDNQDDKSEARFRDYDLFNYWFRAVEKYAPWVNKIYLVTDNQVPEWLNVEHEKLVLVDHTNIIPQKNLPTFNSSAIEVNLKNIEELSEHFVLFNDDMFLNAPVNPEDFFWFDGNPRDTAGLNAIMPIEDFDHIVANNMIIINKNFKKSEVITKNVFKFFNIKNGPLNIYTLFLLFLPRFTRFYDLHIPYSILKSEFKSVMNDNNQLYEETSKNKFRSIRDITIWSVRYTQIAKGIFKPRRFDFGKFYNLTQIDKIVRDIEKCKHKVIDINDSDKVDSEQFKKNIKDLHKAFDRHLLKKSDYEN